MGLLRSSYGPQDPDDPDDPDDTTLIATVFEKSDAEEFSKMYIKIFATVDSVGFDNRQGMMILNILRCAYDAMLSSRNRWLNILFTLGLLF